MNRFLNQHQQPNINLNLNNPIAQAQQEMQMIQAQQEEIMLWNEFIQTEKGIECRNEFQKFIEHKKNPTKIEIEKVDSKIQDLELTIQQLATQNAQMQQQALQTNQLLAQFLQNQQEVNSNGNVPTTTTTKHK